MFSIGMGDVTGVRRGVSSAYAGLAKEICPAHLNSISNENKNLKKNSVDGNASLCLFKV
jgi:hypothetical protein